MKKLFMRKLLIALTACLVLAVSACIESDFAKGKKAFAAKNYIQAYKYYRPAAKEGQAEAQYGLGFMYAEGLAAPRDSKEAIRWFRLSAEQGHADAQYMLGKMHEAGVGVLVDETEAVEWYLLAAGQGHAKAQYSLGELFRGGYDYIEADKWYRLAAEQGHTAALGLIVEVESMIELQKNAAQGIAEAQYEMGRLYQQGKGVPQDDTKAVEWYRKAAEQGHAEAQYHLGRAYALGGGVWEDDTEAAKWYRKAAEQGLAEAQYILGEMYNQEKRDPSSFSSVFEDLFKSPVPYGVPKDEQTAYIWYFLASEKGNESAKNAVTRLEQQLSAKQITDAESEAEKMQAKIDKAKNREG